MKRSEVSTKSAGIDVSKATLDVALAEGEERLQAANAADAFAALAVWLESHGVRRVGLEASGGYERAAAEALRSGPRTTASTPRSSRSPPPRSRA